jgi:integrase
VTAKPEADAVPVHDRNQADEASALLWTDINVETCEISITKSRHLGADSRPKTGRSERTIRVPQPLIEALLTLRRNTRASRNGEAERAAKGYRRLLRDFCSDDRGKLLRQVGVKRSHSFRTVAF